MSSQTLSVLLCTHNPRSVYIERTIKALKAQRLPFERWELVVVDNRCDVPLAERLDICWHPRARILREETLGLTPARLRAIRESSGELLVFVDDDNVLEIDYLEEALRISARRPWLGAWSGQCHGDFEEQPPEWTRRYWGNLALREFDQELWSNLPRLSYTMPCGAGLCVRRDVALEYLRLHEVGARGVQFDRAGDSLLSGGDNDLAGCACLIGLGVGLMPTLQLRHLIPPERLTAEYLERLAFGIHFSSVLLDAEYGVVHKRRSGVSRLINWFRLVRLSSPHRKIVKAALDGEDAAYRALSERKA